MSTNDNSAYPWEQPWPNEGLEELGQCPICGSDKKKIVHADLVDNTFYSAAGQWSLWLCIGCSTAYLDPRPTPDSIHMAYSSYYTHQCSAPGSEYDDLSLLRKIRRQFANGYTNWRSTSPNSNNKVRFETTIMYLNSQSKRVK